MKRFCATALMLAWGLTAMAAGKSSTIVYINGSKYYVHTIQPGETLYSLAKTYQVSEQLIVEKNPEAAAGLKASGQLRIPFLAEVPQTLTPKQQRRTFDEHFAAKGETLYGIARRYEIPIQTIIEDNPSLDPTRLRLGERLLIRKKQIGTQDAATTSAQWEQYRSTLNSVAEAGSSYHIVQPGETFYSLSRRFGLTEEALSEMNGGLKAADLRAGAMLKVPGTTALQSAEQPAVAEEAASITPPIEFRALSPHSPLNIALMLPVSVGDDANANYLEFYQGFLLGLSDVKQKGYSVNLTLYDTNRDPEKIRQIVESADFSGTNLIVGPVYEEGLAPVVSYAEKHSIPVVSPLANLTRTQSDVLFQLAPTPETKYEKVADLLGNDKRITLIYANNTDKDFEAEILAQLNGKAYERYTYKYAHQRVGTGAGGANDLTPLLDNSDDNVFVIMADNEVDVDRILAAIASADTSITTRGRTPSRFTVLGNARWNRHNNLDRTMFFKNRVVMVSTYHAKRDAQVVQDFDSAYIRAFGSLPTLYSYRGYDAAAIFGPAMYDDIQYGLAGRRFTPLQTTYLFEQAGARGNRANSDWTRVNYNTDFTITIQ